MLFAPRVGRARIPHDLFLPSELRGFMAELAGRLALLDAPGREMQALRERHGLTQELMGRVLDMRRESVSRVESGRIGLTVQVLQRFVRAIALAQGVREHLGYAEARGNLPDERHLQALTHAMGLPKDVADEIVLASMMSYEKKRRETLARVGSR